MIEIIRNHWQRGRIRHAVFDFDGTLSLIREGWQSIMIAVMMDALLQTPNHEGEPELRLMASDLVARTAGHMTHYQMACLSEEVAKHHLTESEFVSFGDGTAEIEEAAHARGIAVGVASNEAKRAGLDEHKRRLLIQAGAHIIVPDFEKHEALITYLLSA